VDVIRQQPAEEISFFSQSCVMRGALTQSLVNPEAPIKSRVCLLESAVENQQERDDVTFANIEALSRDTERIERALNEAVNAKTAALEEALQRFKMEVHHRFELQGAENKRLQASVAALKAENRSLNETLVRYLCIIILLCSELVFTFSCLFNQFFRISLLLLKHC
jgi:F0F1-type ATP synthase delta subunit